MKRLLTTLALVTGLTAALTVFGGRPNQKQPLISPSKQFVLTVPVENGRVEPNGNPVWKVTICDPEKKQLYKDDDSIFVGHLNVYWLWDDQDRVWLYNSDDGSVWFWERNDVKWSKARWGFKRTRQIEREIDPPASLYPKYVD